MIGRTCFVLMLLSFTALGCSCAGPSLFSERLPDRTNRSLAVFTAEVIAFDPVAASPKPEPSKIPVEQGGRPNLVSARRAYGEPVQVPFERMHRRVVVQVVESFTGPETIPTEFWTHEQSSACGYDFVVGKKYLIEANYLPPDQPRWTVNKCSRTAELTDPIAAENVHTLQLWKSGKRPPSWIEGQMFGHNPATQIAGIRLTLTDGKVTRFAQSDSRGVFRFDNLSPGVYTLTADIPGTHNSRTIDLRENWSVAPVFDVGFPN